MVNDFSKSFHVLKIIYHMRNEPIDFLDFVKYTWDMLMNSPIRSKQAFTFKSYAKQLIIKVKINRLESNRTKNSRLFF